MILEATNSPRSHNIRSLIDQQQKRKADDSLADERFENQLRGIVDSAVVRKALAELVARRNLPYSCVECPELRALISAFNHAAAPVLPRSHVSVARLITVQYHARRRVQQKQLLCARSKIHLTTDSWTSPNKLEFQAVTCHFVDSEGVLRKAPLCLPELLKGHAGSEVAPIILDSIQNFGIVDRIGYITSDNASSNDTAMSALSDHIPDWNPIQHRTRCLGHCINLAAQAFMSAPSRAAIDYPGYQYFKRIDPQKDRPHVFPLRPITATISSSKAAEPTLVFPRETRRISRFAHGPIFVARGLRRAGVRCKSGRAPPHFGDILQCAAK
jgi:hypothetical protein